MSWADDFAGMMAQPESMGMQLAEMTGANSCKIGNLQLYTEDLLFDDRLLHPTAMAVAGYCPENANLQDKSVYLPALKAGDKVAVIPIKEAEGTIAKYLVLARMVKG